MFSLATQFSPEACNFKTAVLAGYEHAELLTTPTRLMSWKSLSKIARSFDLKYAIHFPTTGKVTFDTCENIVSLANDINCQLVVVEEENLDIALDTRAIEPELDLAVRNTGIHFNQLDDWISEHKSVTLDIEELWKSTLHDCELDALQNVVRSLVRKHKDRIKHIQVSGYLPGHGSQNPLYCSREMILSIFDLLSDENYSGMVVGQIHEQFQNEHELQMDFLLYRTWQSGLRQLAGFGRIQSKD